MKIQLPKWLINATSKIYLTKNPLFFQWNPSHHKVKGNEVRQILDAIQPADILLRTFDGYLNSMLTPGDYGHAAMVVDKNTICHAIGIGVITEDILEFCRCDSLCILRVKNITEEEKQAAVNRALEMKEDHIQYDYKFATEQEEKIKKYGLHVYCSEAVYMWHNYIFKDSYSWIAGNFVLSPSALKTSSHVDIVLEFLHKN